MDLVWLLIWTDQFVRTPHLDNLENLSMDWVLDDIKQLLIIILGGMMTWYLLEIETGDFMGEMTWCLVFALKYSRIKVVWE